MKFLYRLVILAPNLEDWLRIQVSSTEFLQKVITQQTARTEGY